MKLKINYFLLILFFCSFPFLNAQIENPGFEIWEDAGTVIEEPVDWSSIKTTDDNFLNQQAPVVWEQSTDAHTGTYSVKLTNVFVLPGLIAAGTMTNGRVHSDFNPDLGYVYTDQADARWNTPISYRPDSIAFWMKFFPDGDDTLQFQALLHVGAGTLPPKPSNVANKIAYTRTDIPGQHANWTRIALPFDYVSTENPEYLLIILTAGNGTTPIAGSYALFDDIELIGGSQSVENDIFSHYSVFVANRTLHLNNMPQHLINSSEIDVIDLTGKTVYQSAICSSEVSLDMESIISGYYVLRLISSEGIFSRKFYIQ